MDSPKIILENAKRSPLASVKPPHYDYEGCMGGTGCRNTCRAPPVTPPTPLLPLVVLNAVESAHQLSCNRTHFETPQNKVEIANIY